MPLPDSPPPDWWDARNLDMASPMDPRVHKLIVAVMWHNKRVMLRVEEVDKDGQVLDSKNARMGLTLWRTIVLPSFRLYAAQNELVCEIREVTKATGRS